MDKMKMFCDYLKERGGVFTMLFVCAAIFLTVFSLYRIPAAAVLYPLVLCLIVLCGYAAADYVRYFRRRRVLSKLRSLPEDMDTVLSRCVRPGDEEYRELIRLLTRREADYREQVSSRLSDMNDYYTTWVHQIKTPIASMRLTLQNEDTPVSFRLAEDLLRIEQYVEMVLTYIRLDSDSTDYVFGAYPLDGIITASLRRFAGYFINKGISLKYTPADISVITDEKWLGFVIEQLISNALKYTAAGTISVYTEAPATLCISDTGMGIAPEDLPRIFEKGYTGRNGREGLKSSGLGMYLCRRICDALGQTIAVQSSPGEGTTVRIGLNVPQYRHE